MRKPVGEGSSGLTAGGLVGKNLDSGLIDRCFSKAEITAGSSSAIGCLVGYNAGDIENSHSTGTAEAGSESWVGGLVGKNSGTITNCYTTGVEIGAGGATIGRLVGAQEPDTGSVTNSYYLGSAGDSAAGTPLTEEQMKQQESFVDWDFEATWRIAEGVAYPKLKWQPMLPKECVYFDFHWLSWDVIKGANMSQDSVTSKLSLPAKGPNGSTISWSVDDPDEGWIDPATGAVSRPAPSEGDQDVILSATISKERTASRTKEFNLTVKAASPSGGGGGTSGPGAPSEPGETPGETRVDSAGNITAAPELNDSGIAVTEIDDETLATALANAKETDGKKTVEITIPAIEGAKAYEISLPASALTSSAGDTRFVIKTDMAVVTLPGNMLAQEAAAKAKKVSLSITLVDVSQIEDEELRQLIGRRPIIQLSLRIDGEDFPWNNPDSPVRVAIPYTPTEEELANPEHITVWHIDRDAKVTPVPNGRYDEETGTVTFSITHFSWFAVVYVHKTFGDLAGVGWARKPIEVMASKGIIQGTGPDTFSPASNITRADYTVLLIRTLGLRAEFTDNFDDVKEDAYYYEAVGIAKKLGIALGDGDNRFNPEEPISRQDLMTLSARVLDKYMGLKLSDDIHVLDRFIDKGDIAEYALSGIATLVKEGLIVGSDSRISPLANTTRAEAAVFLYRVYNSYVK